VVVPANAPPSVFSGERAVRDLHAIAAQRTIADTLRLDRATVVALVDALEVRGLARRVQSREDRRANAVELTPIGRRVLKRADALMEECETAFVATLREEERGQLQAILERM
jgi:DNA-binding MarR family transcriptional regulator